MSFWDVPSESRLVGAGFWLVLDGSVRVINSSDGTELVGPKQLVESEAISNGAKLLHFDSLKFKEATAHFDSQQKAQRIRFLSTLEFAAQWSSEKLQHFNSEIDQVHL
jgi:hypothetical protein